MARNTIKIKFRSGNMYPVFLGERRVDWRVISTTEINMSRNSVIVLFIQYHIVYGFQYDNDLLKGV